SLRITRSTLFPYTTLFRSLEADTDQQEKIQLNHDATMTHNLLSALTALLFASCAFALEPIPDKLVVLTFDDSAKSHYTIARPIRSEEHRSELQSLAYIVCR